MEVLGHWLTYGCWLDVIGLTKGLCLNWQSYAFSLLYILKAAVVMFYTCFGLLLELQAKEKAAGTQLDGRNIRVDYSITERAHTPTPGVYLGRTSG